jgi:NAD(P)-dependent dehydrogenase (short-subunit alcohol dehydrogenase family)
MKVRRRSRERGSVAVTGAARGIGRAIAFTLAAAGWRVYCLNRKTPELYGSEISRAARARLVPVSCDVSDSKSVATAFETIRQSTRTLHALVNNAGMLLGGPAETFPVPDFERVLRTNATSVFLVSQAAYSLLAAARGATIINLGSFFDRLGVKNNAAYCASKAAVGAITRCLAVEWAAQQIRVVNVAPGFVLTDINAAYLGRADIQRSMGTAMPLGRPGTTDEVAQFVASLLASALPLLTGSTLYLDGAHGLVLAR